MAKACRMAAVSKEKRGVLTSIVYRGFTRCLVPDAGLTKSLITSSVAFRAKIVYAQWTSAPRSETLLTSSVYSTTTTSYSAPICIHQHRKRGFAFLRDSHGFWGSETGHEIVQSFSRLRANDTKLQAKIKTRRVISSAVGATGMREVVACLRGGIAAPPCTRQTDNSPTTTRPRNDRLLTTNYTILGIRSRGSGKVRSRSWGHRMRLTACCGKWMGAGIY